MPAPNRSELAVLRGKTTPESLAAWTTAFAEGDVDLGKRYALALASFVGGPDGARGDQYESYIGRLAPGTRKMYLAALTEFFEWLALKHGRIVPPHKVTRKDAEDYANWLATRPYGLDAEKLKDGDQKERLAIFETVGTLGTTDIVSIGAALPAWLRKEHPEPGSSRIDLAWLHRELGRMVLHDLLSRSPTMEELRREDPRIGIGVFVVVIQKREVPIEQVFQYQLPKPRAVGRATIVGRLSALSAFWDALSQGENVTGKSVLQFNIFRDLKKRVQRGLAAERREASQRAGQLTPILVQRLLAAADGPTLTDKRDAALLWFLVLTGARVSEATRLRRETPRPADEHRWPGWFDARADPPSVEVVRKGGKRQRLPFPPYALKAVATFQAALAEHAPSAGAQSEDPDAAHYLHLNSPRWRYKMLTEPDAPLFPPVSFWGANSSENYQALKPNPTRPDYRRGLTNTGVHAMLKRIAKRAGFSGEDTVKVHAHAFRHFAATAMQRQGKDIREIQAILGHDSITTTERYFAEETSPVALSGQNEILSYIAGATPPEPPAPPEPERPKARTIETYGVPAPEPRRPRPEPRIRRPERRSTAWPAPAPVATQPPEPAEAAMPAELPRVVPAPEVHQTTEGLIAIAPDGPMPPAGDETRNGISPGSPFWVYESMAPPEAGTGAGEREPEQDALHFTMVQPRGPKDRRLATLYVKKKREQVQQVKWLRENYDPWPLNYGLGESSLLPWFARGSASKNGEVTVEVRSKSGDRKLVVVPPLPVFASEQLYSEVKAKNLWTAIEQMRSRWLTESPTKAFGLDRWIGAFQQIGRGLSTSAGGHYRWVPFDALAKVGKDIRAHDDDFLATWLEKNAERYTATVRAFENVQRPRGSAYDEEEWLAFSREFETASHIGVSPAEEIPDWFIVDDPIRDIYDYDAEEFEWFARWIGAITGQKLSKARSADRDMQASFATEQRDAVIGIARELLVAYFEAVAEVDAGASGARETLRMYAERLVDYGVPDPAKLRDLPRSLEARIEAILAIAFPEAGVELVDANVLKSQVFDADTFRLDIRKKTIEHTAEFKAVFAERYDGRDSECVARRAARGMWEHVKRHGIPIERGAERSSEYSLLYSVMLSYMAWIIPCPPAIEKRMTEESQGRLKGKAARQAYLDGFRQASTRVVRATEDLDEAALLELARQEGLDPMGADEVLEAALVQDSVRAEIAIPSPPVAEAIARSAVESGKLAVRIVARTRVSRIVVVDPGEHRPTTYFSVGAEPDEDDELKPNAPPHRYLTPNVYRRGCEYVANVESVMPSALRMMAAMTIAF